MNVLDLLRKWSPQIPGRGHRPKGRRRTGQRLLLEPLEARWLPSVIPLAQLPQVINTGYDPLSNLSPDSNGNLFGTTLSQGPGGNGTIFEVLKGGGFATLASFNNSNGASPNGNLVIDSSGDIFGTANAGGSSSDGTIFELPAGSSTIMTLATFTGTANGAGPIGGLIRDNDGDLFGISSRGGSAGDGTVFELKDFGNSITTLATFTGTATGTAPAGGLVRDPSGALFGTTTAGGTSGDGTLFEVPSGGGVLTLASFTSSSGNVSAGAIGGLFEDSSGNLFGTATLGGSAGMGTIFKLAKGSSTIVPLVTFMGSNGASPEGSLIEDPGGNLLGVMARGGGPANAGAIFEVSPSATLTALVSFNSGNGAIPRTGLYEDSSGNLFGTASGGGPYVNGGVPNGYGTVYELPAGSSTIIPLVTFDENPDDGNAPGGGLILDSSGALYGTTTTGGATPGGTLFEEEPANSDTYSTLQLFGSTSLSDPDGTLLEDSSSDLFGVVGGGGLDGDGALFELKKGAGIITTLGSFTGGSDGSQPEGAVFLDASGNVFGTTHANTTVGTGTQNGTVFEVKAGGGTPTTVAAFTGANGANPDAGVIGDASGNLYGTTFNGGSMNLGTVFEVKAGSGMITTRGSFTGTANGQNPVGGVVLDSSGNLFGLASAGGTSNEGTLYEVKAGTNTITPLLMFNGSNGLDPSGTLIMDSSGNLYGATFNTVFEYRPGTGALVTLGFLNHVTGANGIGALARDSSGDLFGTTTFEGAFDGGSVFEVPASTPPTITTTSLPNWTVNDSGYFQTLTTSGGTGTITFTVTGGTLPTGLSLTSRGQLFGMPTAQGTYNFTITATDGTGAAGSQGYTVVVNPPVIIGTTTLPTGTINTSYSQSISASGGTGALTFLQAGGTLPAGLSLSSAGVLSGTPMAGGSFTFTVAAIDSVGAFASQGYTVIILGPPVKLSFLAQPVNTPTGMGLPAVSVEVLDAAGDVVTTDNSDNVMLGIASGPGSFTAGSTTMATFHNGVATFSNLTLIVPGNYTLSELVPTLYTGPNSSPFTIAPLEVVPGSFAGTPSGFSVQFNTPFLVNSLTPVLYGHGFGATAPPPSVIVTTDPANLSDTASYVEGSLQLNTANNSMTFVATNTAYAQGSSPPQLPDGTYTVILRSSAANDGFQSLNSGGGFLDGLGNGTPGSGDFKATFTVNVMATHEDVVWVPDTADGPGQALSAPGKNQVGGGYPILLDSSTASATNVLLTLNYNPALLTVTGVSGAGFALSNSSTPGQAILQYSGPALPAGNKTPIGFLIATVPGGTTSNPTPYKAKDLLHLSNVAVNGGAAATSDGLHLVAYVGDADGNGMYTANDAVLITRALLSTDSGFAAYPLVDPTIVADTDGSGFLPADAALQANEASVGAPTANLSVPPIPIGVVFQAISNNVDPSLSIPSHVQVGPGGIVMVPVNLDDAHPAGSTGLVEAQLALTYDPRQFTVSLADIHLGSLLTGGGWTLVTTIDPTTGQIGIVLSGTTPISAALAGSLVTIDFHLLGSMSSPAAIELVSWATPNGQPVATELEDAQGSFTLSLPSTQTMVTFLDAFPNAMGASWGWHSGFLTARSGPVNL